MPEGPEVRCITDGLQSFTGQSLICMKSKSEMKGMRSDFLPLRITKIWCYGKRIIFDLQTSNGQSLHMFIFLAMTGIWCETEGKHTKHELCFGEYKETSQQQIFLVKRKLWFDDVRCMGKIKVIDSKEVVKELSKFGPDLLLANDHWQFYHHFLKHAKNSSAKLFEFVMEPKICASIGNYLRADGIFLSGEKDPFVVVKNMSEQRVASLCYAFWRLLHQAYREGGYSLRDYKVPNGTKGRYQAIVYNNSKALKVKDKNKRSFWYMAPDDTPEPAAPTVPTYH